MFTDNEQLDHIYRGYNSDFVQRVWAKRRADAYAQRLAEQERKHREKGGLRLMSQQALQVTRAERDAIRKAERERRRHAEEVAARIAAEGIDVPYDVENVEQSAREIIEAVAIKAGVLYEDLVGKSRAYKILPLRHQAMVEVYMRLPSVSLTRIGKFFNRDHSTIVYALQRAGVKRSSAT
jgi:chromosomal replication initiation ATPase DnaA